MAEKLTLHPIYMVAPAWDDEPFDASVLPWSVVPDVTVEDVSGLFNDDTFRWVEREMGRRDLEDLRSVRYAIVHRYHTEELNRGEGEVASETLVRNVAACLRVIRPMRQRASLMQGTMTPDGQFDVQHFEHPIDLAEVPEVQKLFHLRNADLDILRQVAPQFLAAMSGDYWKVRMAVQFHEGGHWQDTFWKPRFSLWMAGLEALCTDNQNTGRLVTTERVKHLLGAKTNIYEKGDVPRYFAQPEITVGDVLDDLYQLRNYVVHGERVPNEYFAPRRRGINGDVPRVAVLVEALSFILRKSILRVLNHGLLETFKDDASSRQYWRALHLTRKILQGSATVVKVARHAGRKLSVDDLTALVIQEERKKVKESTREAVLGYVKSAIRSGDLVEAEAGQYARNLMFCSTRPDSGNK